MDITLCLINYQYNRKKSKAAPRRPIFLRNIIVQCVIVLVGQGEEASWVILILLVAIALALCVINEKNRRWINEWCKRTPQYTYENLMTDVMVCSIRRSIIWWGIEDCYPYIR